MKSLLAGIIAAILSLFGGSQSVAYKAPLSAPPSISRTEQPTSLSAAAADAFSSSQQATTTPVIYNEFNAAPAAHQYLAAATPASTLPAQADFVTQDQFNASLSTLSYSLRELIAETYTNPVVSGPGAPLSVEAFAPSQSINNLSGTTITNPTISGGSISGTSIPTSNLTGILPVASGGTGWGNINVGSLIFGGGSAPIATSSNLYWDNSNSRLGIGTSSPLTTLSIQGTVGANDVLNIASSTGTSLLYVNAAGNVGVNTNSPAYALDVAGYINSNTGYKFNGNTFFYRDPHSYSIALADNSAASWMNTTAASTSVYNLALGDGAMTTAATSSVTEWNTALGYFSLYHNIGTGNAAVGMNALITNTYGSYNTALGTQVLYDNSVGNDNTGVGAYSMYYQAGSSNTAVGYYSGAGHSTSYNSMSSTGGTYLGFEAGFSLRNGSNYNTMIGNQAGYNVTSGADNILIGSATSSTAIANLTTGSQDILIGENESLPSATANGQLDIGNEIYGTNITGTGSTLSNGNVGIGTASPGATLDVAGSALLDGANNYLNFSSGSGNSGYGFWDNSGTLEFKNANGAWATIGTGNTLGTTVSYVQSLDLNNTLVTDTNSASATTLYTYPVQAGTMGTNKVLRVEISGEYTNNSGSSRTITLSLLYGATTIVSKVSGSLSTSATSGAWHATFYLAATSTNAQLGNFIADASNGATTLTWGGGSTSAVNSTLAQNLVIQATNSAAASTITITKESAETELLNATNTFGSQWVTSGPAISYTGGSVGIGTTTPYAPLEVWGTDQASSTLAFNIVNSGSSTVFAVFDGGNAELSGSLSQSSDQRLKTNIQSLGASSSLAAIDALNPVTFNWIDPNKGTTPQLGFIAQQVLPIFPNLVSTTSATALTPDGTLSLNYIGLISPIVSAIQELSTEFASLAQSITTQVITAVTGNFSVGNFSNELCVGSTCVTPAQFQAMVAAAGESGTAPDASNDASSNSQATDTPPIIQINGDNPAIIQVGDTYNDLGAAVTGPQADLNLGITTYLNGTLTSNIVIDTTEAATDTIDYVAADQSGLTSTSTRTVIIEPAQAPSIVPTADASTTATSTAE